MYLKITRFYYTTNIETNFNKNTRAQTRICNVFRIMMNEWMKGCAEMEAHSTHRRHTNEFICSTAVRRCKWICAFRHTTFMSSEMVLSRGVWWIQSDSVYSKENSFFALLRDCRAFRESIFFWNFLFRFWIANDKFDSKENNCRRIQQLQQLNAHNEANLVQAPVVSAVSSPLMRRKLSKCIELERYVLCVSCMWWARCLRVRVNTQFLMGSRMTSTVSIRLLSQSLARLSFTLSLNRSFVQNPSWNQEKKKISKIIWHLERVQLELLLLLLANRAACLFSHEINRNQ